MNWRRAAARDALAAAHQLESATAQVDPIGRHAALLARAAPVPTHPHCPQILPRGTGGHQVDPKEGETVGIMPGMPNLGF